MKLAITACGPDFKDMVDARFGRAAWFVVHDTETGGFTALENSSGVDAAQGAGVQAAQSVASSGAGVLPTGHCGPKAFAALEAAGLEIYSGVQGTVLDAVRDWRDGRLDRLGRPDGTPGH